MSRNILLLGCGGNAGINFVKSLKKSGEDFKIIGCDLDNYNLISSNADVKHLLQFDSVEEKTEKILDIIETEQIDFIHAQPDPEVRYLAMNNDKLGKYTFGHSLDSWQKFADKLYCQTTWDKELKLGFKSYRLAEIKDSPEKFAELMENSGKVWVRAIAGAGSKAALPVMSLAQAVS